MILFSHEIYDILRFYITLLYTKILIYIREDDLKYIVVKFIQTSKLLY